MYSSPSNRVGVSPSGNYVMVGGSGGKIFFFDLINQQLEEAYHGEHTSTVVSCDWMKRGGKSASIDTTGNLFIWE